MVHYYLMLNEYPYNNIMIMYEINERLRKPAVAFVVSKQDSRYEITREIFGCLCDQIAEPHFCQVGENLKFEEAIRNAYESAQHFYEDHLKNIGTLKDDLNEKINERIRLIENIV